MSGRHQPLNGADSAEALTGLDVERLAAAICGTHEPLPTYGFVDDECRARAHVVAAEYTRPRCAACSLPAVTDGYCAGHDRLFRYTEHESSGGIAANE